MDFSKTPIRAVFVYHDPRNWALDIQVLCDVLQSGGVIGGPYVAHSERAAGSEGEGAARRWSWYSAPRTWGLRPDLGTEVPQPRVGQGAFQAVYKVCSSLCARWTLNVELRCQ